MAIMLRRVHSDSFYR